MEPLQQKSTQNRVENTVKHQVTKRQCPKKCNVIFFWVAIVASLFFLMEAVLAGVIQAVAIVVIWSIYLFFMKNFAYKDSYSPTIMIPAFIVVVVISFAIVSFKTDKASTAQQQIQPEKTEEMTKVERGAQNTIDAHEYSKEKSSALLKKIKNQNNTVPFGEIEDEPFAEWHGENGEVLFRGGEQIKTNVADNTEIHAIEQLLSNEGFEPNKDNEGSIVGGIAYKGFATEEVGCTIDSAHYADGNKHQAEATITCWDLE